MSFKDHRPKLRSITGEAAAERSDPSVITKQDGNLASDPDFLEGRFLLERAYVDRRAAGHDEKLKALSDQNDALSKQIQRTAALMLAIVADKLAAAFGADTQGPIGAVAMVGALVVLLAFPQSVGMIVGRMPLLAALIPTETKSSSTPPKGK